MIGLIPGATNTLTSLVRMGLARWDYRRSKGKVRRFAILTDAGVIARRELRDTKN